MKVVIKFRCPCFLANNESKTKRQIIVHRRQLIDVRRLAGQLVFGDGDVKSTSGHILPKYFAFVKKGINDA